MIMSDAEIYLQFKHFDHKIYLSDTEPIGLLEKSQTLHC